MKALCYTKNMQHFPNPIACKQQGLSLVYGQLA